MNMPNLDGHAFQQPRPSELLRMAAFMVDLVLSELEEEPDDEAEYRDLMNAAQTLRTWGEEHRQIEDSVH